MRVVETRETAGSHALLGRWFRRESGHCRLGTLGTLSFGVMRPVGTLGLLTFVEVGRLRSRAYRLLVFAGPVVKVMKSAARRAAASGAGRHANGGGGRRKQRPASFCLLTLGNAHHTQHAGTRNSLCPLCAQQDPGRARPRRPGARYKHHLHGARAGAHTTARTLVRARRDRCVCVCYAL